MRRRTDLRLRPSMLLAARCADEATASIDRGAAGLLARRGRSLVQAL